MLRPTPIHRTISPLLTAFSATLAISLCVHAGTVFPIANSPSIIQFGFGLATDGTNYMACFESGSAVKAQLISPSSSLVGLPIQVGSSGTFPPELGVAYGGGVYLEVWSDKSVASGGVSIFGQRIAPGGAKIGTPFHLLNSATYYGFQEILAIAYGDPGFLVVWKDKYTDWIYGQLVAPDGTLSGQEFLISDQEQNGGSAAIAYDGTNFLVVWQSNDGPIGNINQTFGAFVTSSGAVLNQVTISQNTSLDQDPLAVAFDGTNYLVVWDEDSILTPAGDVVDWTLYGRLVATDGSFPSHATQLASGPPNEAFPALAFDGTNYLMAWAKYTAFSPGNDAALTMQFLDRSMNLVGDPFYPIPAQGTRHMPFAVNGLLYDGSRYVVGATFATLTVSASGDVTGISSAGLYGQFIPTTMEPPIVDADPASVTNLVGNTASFYCELEGEALSYQWLKNGKPLLAAPRIRSTTSNTLTISNLTTLDAGNYQLVAANVFGSVTSAVATLTVHVPVVITTQVTPAGAGKAIGGGRYESFADVTVAAIITNDCYYFSGWTLTGKIVGSNTDYSFTATNSQTLLAHFTKYSYNLLTSIVPPNGGVVPPSGRRPCGTLVKLTAAPKVGFKFAYWNQDSSFLTTNSGYPLIVSADTALTAYFNDIAAPLVTVTSPLTLAVTSNTTFSVTGKAVDNVGVSGVYYDLGAGPVLATTTNGWTNWSAAVPLATGTNVTQIYAYDPSNNKSRVKTLGILRQPLVTSFPIDVADIIRHPQGQFAFDGSNYLVAFQTGPTNDSHPVAQFVSQNGTLVGNQLQLNPNGSGDPPGLAFDGANYLSAWPDYSHQDQGVPLSGVFITPDGQVSSVFQLSQSTTVDSFGGIVFGGGVYFMSWKDTRPDPLNGDNPSVYGMILAPDGTVVASDFQISPKANVVSAGQGAAGTDGTNFLAVWSGASGGFTLNGRLIASSGNFLTDPFVIYTNSALSGQAITSVTFDGSKFLVLFNPGANPKSLASTFHVLGKFVATDGTVLTNQITLTTDPGPQVAPCATFDGQHYLVTWNQGWNPFSIATSGNINARLFDAQMKPVTRQFTVFQSGIGRTATWAPVLFDGSRFVSVAGLGKMVVPAGQDMSFVNGIIVGAYISP